MQQQQQQMQQQQPQQQQNLNPNTTANTEPTNHLQPPQQISGTNHPQTGQPTLLQPQQQQQQQQLPQQPQMNFQPVVQNTNNSENHKMDYDNTTLHENVQGT